MHLIVEAIMEINLFFLMELPIFLFQHNHFRKIHPT